MNIVTQKTLAWAMALCFLLPFASPEAQAENNITEQEAYEIGIEAYHYLYPLITMDVTRRVLTNVPPGVKDGTGPMNAFQHSRAYPPAEFREVVRPNFDTLYSSAWLDLTKEPMVVSVPDTGGRFYLLPMLDMWSDVFAVPGKRTSGTTAANYAVVPPRWNGKPPAGVERIDSPTRYVWIIGRTQTNGIKDYDAVHKVQDGYRITPLSLWGKTAAPVKFASDPTVDMKTPPLVQVDTMKAAKYFSYGAELMKLNPPHLTDWSQVARLKRIGIVPGKSFDFEKAPSAVKAGLERAIPDALKQMKARALTMARVTNGWQMNTDTMGVYGNYYLKRAIVAQFGLGANQTEDSIFPQNLADSDGNPLNGGHNYELHFNKDEIPPAGAFWSVTLYDSDGFPTSNDLKRNAIGDRDALKYNADGSLDLYFQHATPGAEKESNWLPAPSGEFNLTMRVYAPKPQALDGRWNPPVVKKVK